MDSTDEILLTSMVTDISAAVGIFSLELKSRCISLGLQIFHTHSKGRNLWNRCLEFISMFSDPVFSCPCMCVFSWNHQWLMIPQ